MLRYAIVFFAIAVLFNAPKVTSAVQLRDIRSLIANLQRNEANFNNGRDDRSQEVDENSSSIDFDARELDALINQVARDVYNRNDNKNIQLLSNLKKAENDKTQYMLDGYLKQLLYSPKKSQRIPKISKVKHTDSNHDTKVYLILSPRANLRENDFNDISDLLKQTLTGAQEDNIYPNRDQTRSKSDRRYKGFVFAHDMLARRRNRDSKELYSPQDSMEDYKPKKVRSDYGAAGGRTPIPFIRHRDIYERE